MNITHETVKVVNGVTAMVCKLHGVDIIKYAVLPDGNIRLLWVMTSEEYTGVLPIRTAIDAVLLGFESRLPERVSA